ncbi:MAG: hypothetical protein WC760_02045 [Bacteroidia bacterium]|jgi:hypothetical protein
MRLLIATCLFCLSTPAFAQVIDDDNGKTYYFYDTITHRKVKEIYHHKLLVKIIPDPHHYGQYTDTILHIKNGPYTRYYENGNLECSGYYINEKKDSIWKYYNQSGSVIKAERWHHGHKSGN